jgi:alcohol-forming fatty acyl-CoA reductase
VDDDMQVIDTELFDLLRERHGGKGFQQLVEEKFVALAGDIVYQDLGLEAPVLEELANHIDVIVNIAATTNFYER